MDSVTHEQTELDHGAPLLLVAIADELILVSDPRVVPGDRLTPLVDQIRRWKRENALTARRAAQLLVPHVDQLIKGGALDLPPACGNAAA